MVRPPFSSGISGTFLLTGVVLADSLLLNWPSGMLQSSNLASEHMSRSLEVMGIEKHVLAACGIFVSIIFFTQLLKMSIENFEVLLRNRRDFAIEER